MRFVPIKTKEQQTALTLHRTRQLLVRQRTMLSNALRGHLAELGIVSAKGRNGTAELFRIIADGADSRVSPAVCDILKVLARQYGAIGTEITSIDKSIMALHGGCEASRRLAEIPGIGPVGATTHLSSSTNCSFSITTNSSSSSLDRGQGARENYQCGALFQVVARQFLYERVLRLQCDVAIVVTGGSCGVTLDSVEDARIRTQLTPHVFNRCRQA